MKIASSATRDKFPLSPRKIFKKTFSGTIVWVILFLIVYAAAVGGILTGNSENVGVYIAWSSGVILGLLCLIILCVYFYQRWYFAVYFYDLTNDYIVIKKGPITPSEITIPYERVQDVYVDQDLLDRIFGIYDVHLSSATISSGMAAHIDGVEKAAADGLRAVLLDTVHSRISRHKGQDVMPAPAPAPAPAPIAPPVPPAK